MHLVTKNYFEIDCNSAQFGKEVQNQLAYLLEKDFYPKFKNLLDVYDDKTEVWKIDCLNIDLGIIEKRNWKEILISNTLVQIEDFLKTNKPVINSNKSSLKNDGLIPEKPIVDELISVRDNAQNLFFNYLKYGFLEENSISNDLVEIIRKLKFSEIFVIELVKLFHQNHDCVLRFIFSTPEEFKEQVYQLLNFKKDYNFLFDLIKINRKNKPQLLKILEKFHTSDQAHFWFKYLEWMVSLLVKNTSQQTYIKQFIDESRKNWGISEIEIKAVFNYFIEKESHFDSEYLQFFQLISDYLKVEDLGNKKEEIPHEFPSSEKLLLQKTLYIENAGLVILHPFLINLFEKLNLCKSDIWKNEISQQKAILLSQYLVKGNEEIQENELLLNKILCGFDLNKVINTKLKITKTEKEQCENLLKAVLEHWTAMSKSSTVALQETFLQRNAKLEELGEKQFEMWVEEKGFDILLNQLPWGIGMIKTPWMDEFLICNW